MCAMALEKHIDFDAQTPSARTGQEIVREMLYLVKKTGDDSYTGSIRDEKGSILELTRAVAFHLQLLRAPEMICDFRDPLKAGTVILTPHEEMRQLGIGMLDVSLAVLIDDRDNHLNSSSGALIRFARSGRGPAARVRLDVGDFATIKVISRHLSAAVIKKREPLDCAYFEDLSYPDRRCASAGSSFSMMVPIIDEEIFGRETQKGIECGSVTFWRFMHITRRAIVRELFPFGSPKPPSE